jgi:DNA polymerase-3 subunit delta'
MWQVFGQESVITLLNHSISKQSIAHAYLLVGPRHVGKTTLARNLSQALNCTGHEPPCGQCSVCQRIIEDKHADVISTSFAPGQKAGIDDIRYLQLMASRPPYEGKYKVFIIDEAEHLSTEAANSLLKIMEEPPPRIVWLLLTSEESLLLPTVISRCQKLILKPLPVQTVEDILTMSYSVEPGKARLLARLSSGCIGWAITALKNPALLENRQQEISKISLLLTSTVEERFAYAQDLSIQFQRQKSASEILANWLAWWHDLLLTRSGQPNLVANLDCQKTLAEQASSLNIGEISNYLTVLSLAQDYLMKNVNPRLVFESLMLDMPGKEFAHV